MELLKPKVKDYPGEHIKIKIDNPSLNFVEAKDFAKQKAKEICAYKISIQATACQGLTPFLSSLPCEISLTGKEN